MLNIKIGLRKYWYFLFPVIMGMAAFYMVVGPGVLSPTNLGWLRKGDPATHYLGWVFFRDSPWSFPIGLNPSYGLELSSSIVYSDSIPLMAFLFKIISIILPRPFQYFGLWLLFCFIAQACFSWLLLSLITKNKIIISIGTAFFLFSPPMIFLLSENIGHFALAGHFLIVAALYVTLNNKSKKKKYKWMALFFVAGLVHAYIFAMLFLLWVGDLATRIIKHAYCVKDAINEILIIIVFTSCVFWQAGYFTIGSSVASGGFGFFRMNILSIIDSSGWSYILRDIPEGSGDYEGFNFLGIGVILLIIIISPTIISGRIRATGLIRNNFVLFFVFLCFTLFAFTNKVGLGSFQYDLPLPQFVLQGANVFRSSGRMFWPVFYLIFFLVILAIVKTYDARTSSIILGLALFVQVADTSAGWILIRQKYMEGAERQWNTPFSDSFWNVAANRYDKIRYIPPQGAPPQWHVLALYASQMGLATNAVYLARYDKQAIQKASEMATYSLSSGDFEIDTIYILDDSSFEQALANIDRSKFIIDRIDGFNVIASK